MKFWSVLLLPLWLLAAGCSATSDTTDSLPKEVVQCPEPRPTPGEPVACMQIYDPVCALGDDGQWRHSANACEACANPDNIAYLPHRQTPESCPAPSGN
ncbi:hypothetical protein [Motiliproteus coralliicola]|uniref:hypothetical protein n=1 Tax=Motiliproteus coralliicola TaxID=2283196 RepID=UPI001058DB01|nr:hypothetical protein [Motiliproteus coralliicola]